MHYDNYNYIAIKKATFFFVSSVYSFISTMLGTLLALLLGIFIRYIHIIHNLKVFFI